MIISPFGTIPKTAGEILSLECMTDVHLLPTFKWSFGPWNSSLPSGVTVSNVMNNGSNYTSTLQFSQLREVHTGIYTCQVGNLAASVIIIVGGV